MNWYGTLQCSSLQKLTRATDPSGSNASTENVMFVPSLNCAAFVKEPTGLIMRTDGRIVAGADPRKAATIAAVVLSVLVLLAALAWPSAAPEGDPQRDTSGLENHGRR